MLLIGDNLPLLQRLPRKSIHLVITSPPYAQQRSHTYGGVAEDDFADFILSRTAALIPALADDGSFILNIKEHTHNGFRSLYVYELVLALDRQGWKLIDDFPWVKPNPVPGGWKNRLKDGWEHCFHFARQKDIKFRPDQVRVPVSEKSIAKAARYLIEMSGDRVSGTGAGFTNDWSRSSRSMLATPSEEANFNTATGRPYQRLIDQGTDEESATGSGLSVNDQRSHGASILESVPNLDEQIGKRRYMATGGTAGVNDEQIARQVLREQGTARPSNVLHLAVEGRNRGHSAVFPIGLPRFFIQLLTDVGDVVLDPFAGSGTTVIAAHQLRRHAIGMDINRPGRYDGAVAFVE